jgi:hypothetical protein
MRAADAPLPVFSHKPRDNQVSKIIILFSLLLNLKERQVRWAPAKDETVSEEFAA